MKLSEGMGMKSRFCKVLTVVLVSLLLAPVLVPSPTVGAENFTHDSHDVFIGVLAKRSPKACFERWRPLADYLSGHIVGKRFHIVQLPFDQVEAAVAEERVDFIFVNPSIYINLEVKYKVSCILTLIQEENEHLSSEFGGVLFHLAERGCLNNLQALRGRSLVATDPTSLSWQALLLELQEKGVLPERDLTGMIFAGSHDKVVYDVLAGKADFGVVRTGTLERMSQEGLIELKKLAVIHDHGGGPVHLPFIHSTRAYPEWPLAKLIHTNDYLANRVAMVLLALEPVDAVAVKTRIGGWNTALNYQPVHELLQALKLPPYEHLGEVSVAQIWQQYYRFIIALVLLVLLVMVAVIGLFLVNRRVRALQREQEQTIADLHLAEEREKARSYLAQELLDAIPMPVFYLDRQGDYRGCNLAFEKFAGFSKKELRGKPGAEFPVAEYLRVVQDDDCQLFLKGGVRTREVELETKAGVLSYLELRISVYRERDRRPAGLIGVINDLTSHKLMVRRTAQLGAVIEQAAESIVITDLEGIIQYVNPAFEKGTGYLMSEAIGKNPSILKSGRQDESFYKELWETLYKGHAWHGTFVNKHKDGTLFDEDEVIFPIRNDLGEIISLAAVKRDITKEKAMQVQLRTSQRLEAVGQLAAGVASELDTPVALVASNFESITGYIKKFVELLELYRKTIAELAGQLPESGPQALAKTTELEGNLQIGLILDDLDDLFSESKDGFERITSIVTKLREFSRIDQTDVKESFNFNRAIESTIVVALNEYKYSAEVELELDPELPEVMASGGEVNQVILNLIINAAQAIKEQELQELGQIKITTDFDEEWVRCRITDNGPGIMPENMERIFDPFFTTKPVGKGTGLGLNISYDIITNKHNGSLTVESVIGQGTTFTIALPRQNSTPVKGDK
ncbi:MAG: PhnD/SsuA/transferrin family substrate-binding protein [Deltaproteobacteria bacterium]|nr:PhnD/SsuA/transferrin family substrate-binding protein [Candidatus Tharpella sp.]